MSGHLVEVVLVLARQDHCADAGPEVRTQIFSFTPPTSSTRPRADLAGHGHVALHRSSRQRRDQRGRRGDAGRGPSASTPHPRARGCGCRSSRRWPSMPSRSALARAKVSAACADSRITSPSRPVSTSVPRPSITETSIAIVIAAVSRPAQPGGRIVARLGQAVAAQRRTEVARHRRGDLRVRARLGHAPGHLAADRADLALEVAHAGLVGVRADQQAQGRLAERDQWAVVGRAVARVRSASALSPLASSCFGTRNFGARSATSPPRCSPTAR